MGAGNGERDRLPPILFIKNAERVFAPLIEFDRIGQAIANVVVVVEGQHRRLQVGDAALVEIDGVANDDLIAGLAGPGRRAVEDAASGAALAEYDIGGDARPGVPVPDLDELHRQDSRRLAVIRIQGDGAMIIEVGLGHVNAVKFASDQFSHVPPRASVAFS
ncbi:hypothetical protein ABIA19_004648 [Sinorhizobium fredii]